MEGLSLCGTAAVFNIREENRTPNSPPKKTLPSVPMGRRPSFTSQSMMSEVPGRPTHFALDRFGERPDEAPMRSQARHRATKAVTAALLLRAEAITAEPARAVPVPVPPSAPPPPYCDAMRVSSVSTTSIEQQRMRAVQRLRERREAANKAELEEKTRAAEARGALLLQVQASKDQQEDRAQHRAEVIALNRLLQQRDEASYAAFAAARADQFAEVEARHAAEDAARRAARSEQDEAMASRLKEKEAEVRVKKAKAKAEAEAAAARREQMRADSRLKEEEREAWRAQVYAIRP